MSANITASWCASEVRAKSSPTRMVMICQIREFHLFAGCGGGILGGMLNGSDTVGVCEIEDYNNSILKQRASEYGLPIKHWYKDIRNLNGSDIKNEFEILCGGFPCQAFSTAARGRNLVEKNLWGEMLRVIKESEAKMVFAENVSERAINEAEKDLQTIGYRTETVCLGANDLGGEHKRKRFWLLAYTDNQSELLSELYAKTSMLPKLCHGVWSSKPEQSRVRNGVSNRVDRFRATGNGQVPFVVSIAQRILINRAWKSINI